MTFEQYKQQQEDRIRRIRHMEPTASDRDQIWRDYYDADSARKQKKDDACLNQSWQITEADQREDRINGKKVQ